MNHTCVSRDKPAPARPFWPPPSPPYFVPETMVGRRSLAGDGPDAESVPGTVQPCSGEGDGPGAMRFLPSKRRVLSSYHFGLSSGAVLVTALLQPRPRPSCTNATGPTPFPSSRAQDVSTRHGHLFPWHCARHYNARRPRPSPQRPRFRENQKVPGRAKVEDMRSRTNKSDMTRQVYMKSDMSAQA